MKKSDSVEPIGLFCFKKVLFCRNINFNSKKKKKKKKTEKMVFKGLIIVFFVILNK